jgi:hypothetical protein
MSVKLIVRKILLAFFLGCRADLGIGMSRKDIEGILYSMNQTKVEVTIPEQSDKCNSKSTAATGVEVRPSH